MCKRAGKEESRNFLTFMEGAIPHRPPSNFQAHIGLVVWEGETKVISPSATASHRYLRATEGLKAREDLDGY